MSLHGRKHRLVCSSTNQDSSSLETVDIQFRLQSGHNQGPSTTEFYRGSQETGGESHLEEIAPTPIAVDYSKSAQFAGDDMSCLFFSYYASHGGAASTSAEIATTTGVYENIWEGPTTGGVARSFSMEDQGDPAASDTDINRDVYNCTPTRVSISGARRGVITVSADIAGGQAAGNAAGQTAGTWSRNALFNFGMSHCFSTSTLTPAGGTTYFTDAGGLDTDAEILGLTELGGSPVSLTSALQEFTIDFTQDLDLQRSMAPGNLTAAFAGYVPASTDWVYGEGQQQCEFEMVFNQNHSAGSNLVETLLAEYEAGTRRGWEIWLVHPTLVGASNGAYRGYKVTCPNMTPVSWAEENDGMGERYVRVRYRAGWGTVDDLGWHVAGTTSLATALGAA